MKKILGFAIGPIGSALLGIISLPLLAWYFSVEDIGRISMLQVTMSFCILFFSLGLDQSYIREFHDSDNKPLVLKLSVFPGLLLLCISSTILILSRPTLISEFLFSISSEKFSWIVILSVIATFLSRFLSLILRMQERGVAFSMSQVLPKFLFIIVIVFYVLFGYEYSFDNLILAHLFSILMVTGICFWNTRNEWLSALTQSIDLEKLQVMLRFGFPLIFAALAFWALTAMDKIFLKHVSTLAELGIYSIAVSIASAAAIIGAIFNTLWAPTVYKWASEGKNLKKIDEVSEYVQLCILLIFVIVGLFSWLVPLLLPDEYQAVQFILPLAIAAPLFYTLSETTAIGIGLKKKTSYAMLASIVAAIVNLCGNYILIPRYGALGAAVATSTSMWLFFMLRTEFAALIWRRIGGVKIYISSLMPLLGAMLFAFGIISELHVYLWFLVLVFGLYMYRAVIAKIMALFKNTQKK